MIWMKLYLAVVNLLGFLAMGDDKRRARKKQWRIAERTLFGIAVLGGGAGVWLGMYLFRHKTKTPRFVYGIPAIVVAEVLFFLAFSHRQ